MVVVPEISAGTVAVMVVVSVPDVAVAPIHEHACETSELGKTASGLGKGLRRFRAAFSAGTVVKVYEPLVAAPAVVVVNEVMVASAVPVPDRVVCTVEVATLVKDPQQFAAESA